MTRPVAEQIAEVVADIRAGRVQHPAAFDRVGIRTSAERLTYAQLPQPVVDCTAIFDAQLREKSVALYEDYPSVTPPWPDAMLAFTNTHGNVIVLQVHRVDWDGSARGKEEWFTDNEVDWTQVRWIAETAVWVGGQSGDGQPMPTSGPCHLFRHAVNADGSPADINWLALMVPRGRTAERGELDDPNRTTWDASLITLQAALNFLNASNVSIAEPARDRPTRRRIERLGVQVQTIVVRPPGPRRAAQAAARPIDAAETVVSPVRGHFSHYGEQYGRGLLFGKYAGKFWIPGHVRGAGGEPGEDASVPRDYVLKPARS